MHAGLIRKLKESGVEFAEGLLAGEIRIIEEFYKIKFPEELKLFYMEALPISKGFYNWRSFDEGNTNKIKERIACARIDVEDDIDNIDWPDSWEKRPETDEERYKVFLARLNAAAPIVPIYKHRYISSQYDSNNPVFSIMGTDIIYYGENLTQYFMIEFGYEKHSDIDYSKINKVDFWSEIL